MLLLLAPWTSAPAQQGLYDSLLARYVKEGAVDYDGIRKDGRLGACTAALAGIDPASITDRNQRLAHWINVYNAFTLNLVAAHPSVRSIREIGSGGAGPWDSVWIPIAGRRYSLNGIEHDIIRKEFDDPLIHFALVCAARGCPPLRSEAYTGDRLAGQLMENAQRFLRDTSFTKYDPASNTLFMSELLSWYGDDFRARYGSAAAFVLSVLGERPPAPPAVKFLPYDWSLNDQRAHLR